MTNLKWKYEVQITGIDEEAVDRILNWMRLVVEGYGGTLSGGFVPDNSASGEASDGKENTGPVQDG